jgi:hypothetical protein
MIDWGLMESRYWNNTREYPDRRERRQAEFLVHRFFPWELIGEIGVYGKRMEKKVLKSIQHANVKPVVSVHREWYY